MPSVQELETKVLQLERMLHFVMTSFQGVQQSPIAGAPPRQVSMLDMYYEKQAEAEFVANDKKSNSKLVVR
jgi:hypothetical protein